MRDSFQLDGEKWSLWLIAGQGFFEPDDHDFQRGFGSTACYRGYVCTYGLREERLELVRLINGRTLLKAKPFRGIEPTLFNPQDEDYDHFVGYDDIGLPIPFSGGIVLVHGKAIGGRSGIGPELVFRFAEVRELLFLEGRLVENIDRSEEMEKLREELSGWNVTHSTERTKENREDYSNKVWGIYYEMERRIDEQFKLRYYRRE